MSGDRYLRDFNENLERLRGVFEEYDSTNQSLGQLNAITDDIEDVFENIITENEDLSRRLGYRKEQGETYQEIIEDMSDKIDKLKDKDDESTAHITGNVNWGNQVLSEQPPGNLNFGNQVVIEDYQTWSYGGSQPNSDDLYEEWRSDENCEIPWYDEPEWA
ncbi:hypothetical protein GLU60_03825 [Nanohaloarchaea archaeon H01]|nr:hypothetical protein [Nanohaloarchaea archaeon H01]